MPLQTRIFFTVTLGLGLVSCGTSRPISKTQGSVQAVDPTLQGATSPTHLEESRRRTALEYRSQQDAPEWARYYQAARQRYDQGDRASALKDFEAYVKAQPQGQFADEALFLLGKEDLDQSRLDSALARFNAVVALDPPSRLRGDAIYAAAVAESQKGLRREALTRLATIALPEVSVPTRGRLFQFWGSLAADEGRNLEATLAWIKARKEFTQPQPRRDLEQLIVDMIDLRLSESELQFVLREYPTQYPNTVVQMRLVTLKLAAGQRLDAQALLQQVVATTAPTQELHKRALSMLDRLKNLGEASPGRIGVLVPLSGPQEAIGKSLVEGLSLGLERGAKLNLDLVRADAGPTVETAVAAFERLVFEERVMAVVGPVSGNQADAVVAKAVEWGVPNITLASRPGLTQRAANIFRLALTPENQVRGLVTYASERLGARRFAILFPEDRFGREFASEYFQVVEEMGGLVSAAESYDPNQSDFRTQIENMTGLGMLAYRKTEAEDLLKALTTRLGREPTKKEIEKQAALPPIVDFDVLFIPDTFRAVGQIAPALIYSDVSSPVLMGPSTWNNSRLLERAGQHLEKSVFVDVFSTDRKGQSTIDFINVFQNRKGQLPNAMSALGYDVGTALKMAFSSGGPVESRDELRSRLEVLGSFDGATGLMNWNSNREALQELQLFQVRRGAFAHQGSVMIPQGRDP